MRSRPPKAGSPRSAFPSAITSSAGRRSREIAQTEIEQKYGNAVETYKERQREHDDMAAKVAAELAVKASNFAKLEAAFNKVIEATGQRVQSLDCRREESRAADGEGPDDAGKRRRTAVSN